MLTVMADLDPRYQLILGKQLAMNEQMWRTLQGHGLTEATELRLDFTYVAPDRASAESLKTVLEDQTDYDVIVRSAGGWLRRKWSVEGTTKPTTVTAEKLDNWVDWMVTAGLHQNCELDGWGTQF